MRQWAYCLEAAMRQWAYCLEAAMRQWAYCLEAVMRQWAYCLGARCLQTGARQLQLILPQVYISCMSSMTATTCCHMHACGMHGSVRWQQ
jgi:hypothetical protein